MESNRSPRVQLLQTQLDTVNAQNIRVEEENAMLRHKLNRLINDQRSNATMGVEAKIKALKMEDERDQMYENLEKLKKKYNKLHDAYLEKVKRCKALEETFKRQKTLTGLVMKSAIEQHNKEQNVLDQQRLNDHDNKSATENLELQITKLQAALDEAYDIIDELEFELESIDYLEMENQRMQKELTALKSKPLRTSLPLATDEAPPRYENIEQEAAIERNDNRHQVASSMYESYFNVDDADSETLERSALTHSLIETAEAESNCLRRELLKSRLQNTKIRPKCELSKE